MKIIDTTKKVLRENKLYKFLAIGGGVAAVTDTFTTLPLVHLVEYGGIGAGAIIANKVMKGDQSLKEQSRVKVYAHMGKSAFLALGGGAAHVATHLLPFSHITSQVTGTVIAAGVLGFADASKELYSRRNKVDNLEQAKEKNTNSLMGNKKAEEVGHSEAYISMKNKNFKATDEEVEASELGLSKAFKKR